MTKWIFHMYRLYFVKNPTYISNLQSQWKGVYVANSNTREKYFIVSHGYYTKWLKQKHKRDWDKRCTMIWCIYYIDLLHVYTHMKILNTIFFTKRYFYHNLYVTCFQLKALNQRTRNVCWIIFFSQCDVIMETVFNVN